MCVYSRMCGENVFMKVLITRSYHTHLICHTLRTISELSSCTLVIRAGLKRASRIHQLNTHFSKSLHILTQTSSNLVGIDWEADKSMVFTNKARFTFCESMVAKVHCVVSTSWE